MNGGPFVGCQSKTGTTPLLPSSFGDGDKGQRHPEFTLWKEGVTRFASKLKSAQSLNLSLPLPPLPAEGTRELMLEDMKRISDETGAYLLMNGDVITRVSFKGSEVRSPDVVVFVVSVSLSVCLSVCLCLSVWLGCFVNR